MIISHPATTLNDEMIRIYDKNKNNQIQIILQDEDNNYNIISIQSNRLLFVKGCGSEDLMEAAKQEQDRKIFQAPSELMILLQIQSNHGFFNRFIKYLVKGRLQMETRQLRLGFLLACVFGVRQFFYSIIDQNLNISFDRQDFRRTIIICSFDKFNNLLNQGGKYNFVEWLFKKYRRNWFDLIENEFHDNKVILETFMIQYSRYKIENQQLKLDDIYSLISICKTTGKSTQQAKRKIKALIKWQLVPVKILQEIKSFLKITNEQEKLILQNRLKRLSQGNNIYQDRQYLQLKERADLLKKQTDNIIINQGILNLRKQLIKSGINNKSVNQNSYSSNSFHDNSFNQSTSNKNDFPSQNSFSSNLKQYQQAQRKYQQQLQNNSYIKGFNNQQQQLMSVLDKVINKPGSQQNYKPNFTKNNNNSPYQQNKNNSSKHQFSDCKCQKVVNLNCRCSVCYDCMRSCYIQKSQKYEYLSNPNFKFKAEDIKNYQINCYLCNKLLNEMDASRINSM